MGILSGFRDVLNKATPKDFIAAVSKGDARRVTAILRRKPEFASMTDDKGRTALHNLPVCAQGDNVAVAQALISHGANVNARDGQGSTPLHLAAYGRGPKLIGFLLAHGAEVNARDRAGDTPLHVAAGFGLPMSAGLTRSGRRAAEAMQTIQVAATKVLLASGADAKARNAQNQTPLDRAERGDQPAVADVLRSEG